MKVLVLAPQPFFTPRGTPFSVYYRTLTESKLGCTIDLLTYGEGYDVDIPGVRIIRIPRLSFLGNVKIGPSFLKFFLDILLTLWFVKYILFNRYDIVHAHEEAVFICLLLKPIFRFNLLYDMHSSLSQQLQNFNFTKSKFIYKIFKHLEIKSLRSSKAVITICPDLYNYASKFIEDNNRIFLIENSIFDPVRLQQNKYIQNSINDSPMSKAKTFMNQFDCVVYTGNLEPYQGIDLLIDAFAYVATSHHHSGLLIIGGSDSQVSTYKEKVQQKGLNNRVFFTGFLSPDAARNLCRSASVIVSPRCSGTNTPLKIYEHLASGIPIVATSIYSHTQVLNEQVAILADPDPVSLSSGIIEAMNKNDKVLTVAKNAKLLYENNYSKVAYEKKMKNLLEFVA